MIDAPIPGESLTAKPKNAPYENPPQTDVAEDALYFHLDKLTDDVRMDSIMQLLEEGMPVQTAVEGLLRAGVANGIHSIDISLMIGPVIHEYIKGFADNLGIDYKEGPDFEEPDWEKTQTEAGKRKAKMPSISKKFEEEERPAPPRDVQDPPSPEPAQNTGKGLMSRPTGDM
jgi:hypothetical protein